MTTQTDGHQINLRQKQKKKKSTTFAFFPVIRGPVCPTYLHLINGEFQAFPYAAGKNGMRAPNSGPSPLSLSPRPHRRSGLAYLPDLPATCLTSTPLPPTPRPATACLPRNLHGRATGLGVHV